MEAVTTQNCPVVSNGRGAEFQKLNKEYNNKNAEKIMNKFVFGLSFLFLYCGTICFGQGTSGMPGVVFTRIGSEQARSTSSAFQSDGKVIAAGYSFMGSRTAFTLIRYNSNGSRDTSFNSNGIVITAVGSGDAQINAITVQPDGKIIAVGTCFTGANDDFAVVRYNSDGSLDTSFNGTGIVTTPIGNGRYDRAYAVALQPDGKIVVVGSDENPDPNGSNSFAAVVRYNPNGSLDTTFNGTGKLSFTPSWLIIARAMSVTPQSDGKLLIGGNLFVVRLNTNGSFDTSFNGNGRTQIGLFAYSILQQTDGKILAGGSGGAGFAVTRLNGNGTIDTSFGDMGRVSVNPNAGGTASALCHAATFQSDGKIVLSGGIGQSGYFISMVRFNADGSLDTTFNGTGILNSTISYANGYSYSVKVHTDGKIISTGSSFGLSGFNISFTTARYNPNGTLDTTFDGEQLNIRPLFNFNGDRFSDISIYRPSAGEWWYLPSIQFPNVAALQFGTSTDKIVPADYTGDGKTDIALWRPSTGQWFILRSENNSFFSFPFGISEDIPLTGDFDGDNKSDAAIFRPSNSTWYISKSSGGTDIFAFGTTGDKPIAADYDGDGKTDVAIFRPSNGQWWIRRSSNDSVIALEFGVSTDKPVPGDYTRDGKSDIAFWRPLTGEWFILRSEDFSFYAFPFGSNGDIPAPADYDGNGLTDAAIFRPSTATWYLQIRQQGSPTTFIRQFGNSTDIPVPSAFIP